MILAFLDRGRFDHGLTYANCGDWMDSFTALAEDTDGRLRLTGWVARAPAPAAQGEGFMAEAVR